MATPTTICSFDFELRAEAQGFACIAGLDEAGRGALAGPVVAAAVVLPRTFAAQGLTDSKKLTPRLRNRWYERLTQNAQVRWSVGIVESQIIDQINILRATHQAMIQAIQALDPLPDFALIDGLPVHPFPFQQQALIKGDSKSYSIAAASVIAKVTRDRLMTALAQVFPQYGFDQHKGYATAIHRDKIRQHGPCIHHRQTFAPVANFLLE